MFSKNLQIHYLIRLDLQQDDKVKMRLQKVRNLDQRTTEQLLHCLQVYLGRQINYDEKRYMIMLYQSSRFNEYYQIGEACLVLNTLFWKVYEIPRTVYFNMQHNTLNEDELMDSGLIKRLLDNHLIVDADFDEVALMEHQIYQAQYSQDLKVTILPTEACNFRCVYCYEDHQSGKMSEQTEQRIHQFFRKYILKYRSVNIEWFGGEPLLQKDCVIRIAQTVKQEGRRHHVPVIASMTTNGYELDVETMKCLIAQNILYFQITLDGMEEAHDRMRPHDSGKGTFQRIFKNLVNIQENISSHLFKIAIRINVSKSNAASIPDFVAFLNRQFGTDHRFSILIERVHDWGGNSVKMMQENLYNDLNSLNGVFNQVSAGVMPITRDFGENLSNRMCHSFKDNGLVFNFDGRIFKCAKMMYEKDEKIKKNNELGYLDKNGKIVLNVLRNAQWLTPPKWNEACFDCKLRPVCYTLHCPASRFTNREKCLKTYYGAQNLEVLVADAYRNGDVYKIKGE